VAGVVGQKSVKRVVALGVAAFAAVALVLSLSSAPATAQATDACAISRFTSPDGAVDVTGYLQCLGPSVSSDTVVPGGQITFSGGGFASGCRFEVFLDSTPLGTYSAGPDGNFSVVVTIPSDAAPGESLLVAECPDPDGNPLRIERPIQVLAAGATLGSLPYTGSNTLQLVGVGVALLLVGGAVVVGIRRKGAGTLT